METIIMHIDVNNAFLSWTAVDLLEKGYKYDIRNSYAAIGGDEEKRHGIILAKSTPAKKMGVKTAETLASARRKCPALRIFSPNYHLYQEKSRALFKLLSSYSPDLEKLSIDECFLDYGKVKSLYGDEVEFAYRLKKQIKEELGFTVNIGIGRNRFCAKMASDFSKPDKVHTLWPEEISSKLWPLDVAELYGVGKSTSKKLHELNINQTRDLAKADLSFLTKYFKNQAKRLIEIANGIDSSEIISASSAPKGISNSLTLEKDYTSLKEINDILNSLSENVALSLRKQEKYATVVAVMMKNKYFKTSSHQIKLTNPTNITSEIAKTVRELFLEMWDKTPVRLLGVRLDNLVSQNTRQISLFEQEDKRENEENLEKALDKLKEKYGTKVITSATTSSKKVSKKY